MTSDRLRSLSRRIALAASVLALATPALAHDTKVGELRLTHAWAPPSVPGARNGAAYFVAIENGGAADTLVRASTPVAGRVEVHTMAMDGGVMRMREVGSIPVAAKQTVAMQPGNGYHFMLMDLKQPLKIGDRFPMTVVFEKAGKADVEVVVQERRAGGASAAAHSH